MRQLGLGLYLIGALAFAQSDGDAAALYSGADVVFTGQLETVAPSPTGLRARFNVTKLIKGREAVEKELLAQLPAESRCHALEERHSYLIYGRSIGDQLWIDPCEGSKLVSLAEADLRYIHKVNPKISEQCNRERLAQLARSSRVVATAEVLSTEDSLGTSNPPFRPWCGLTLTTEDAYYHVVEVLKGEVNDPKITVEHAICWDTVTVDGYSPALSSELFKKGNMLLLFLKPSSHTANRQGPAPFLSVYEDIDENCGAVKADDDVAVDVIGSMRADPAIYRYHWLDEDVDCLVGANGETSCVISKN